MGKNIFKSKTFWFNLLGATAMFAEVTPELQPFLIPGITIGNILLRTVTKEPVTILPKSQ